ncbi:MAG: hypothetical protein GF350_14110 [Chitinivibrionales bacterium]|nr:hypothetical protein [Chitinivibrionales bacterium]
MRCITAPPDLKFDIFYAVSSNRYCWVDIEHPEQVLDYRPTRSVQEFD